ncbi:sensor histidine kinase [Undibacterium fentianense]|uniref:Histidine kinase n=1 Tax=Undibacterium fentianense TaxID=2828728 RepID=A0A941IFF8_9BURK|nr:histidine kinase [Undibacterium fentianense]MBR7800671.1 histidine kinase [Undibacterium fentianense]
MWRIYGIAWLSYAVFISLALQFDRISLGSFDWWIALRTIAGTLPAALLLALVWPFSRFLFLSQYSNLRVVCAHIAAAFLFALVMFALMFGMAELSDGPQASLRRSQPMIWYMWPFLYNLMMYGVIAGIFHAVHSSKAAVSQQLAINRAHSLLVEAELSALRNKLNPHFLFNTLHSIIALVRKDTKAAEAALFRFSDMLRYILETEKSGQDRVSLDDEIQFVRDYLELEAIRLGNRLQVSWRLDPEALCLQLPALTIQPLVENSIKHAFNPRSQPSHLQIMTQLSSDKKFLSVKITDDGPGAVAEQVAQAPGMGIRTIERRLQLAYGDQASLQIETAPDAGFAVSLSLPML